jgi:hypothetical protein
MSGIAASEAAVMNRLELLAAAPIHPDTLSPTPNFNLPPTITLQQILSLSLHERHQIVGECLSGIIADFDEFSELRELALDSSDWELEDD